MGQDTQVNTNIIPEDITSLEDIQIYNEIGSGGFASVYAAKTKNNNWVALKVIEKQRISNCDTKIVQINHELQILQQVAHPNIVSLFGAFQNQKYLFIILNLVRGGTLLANLKQKRKYTQTQTVFIVAQIVLGLDHLHKQNVIMRDLKPENILVQQNGYIQITDFGVSKLFNDETEQNAKTLCGTLQYLAPEQLRRRDYTKLVDFWGLGVITYMLMTGFNLFDHSDEEVVVKQILQKEPIFDSRFSPAMQDFIRQCLQKNEKKRIGRNSQEIFGHKVFDCLDWQDLYDQKYNLENLVNLEGVINVKSLKQQNLDFQHRTSIDLAHNFDMFKDYQIDSCFGQKLIQKRYMQQHMLSNARKSNVRASISFGSQQENSNFVEEDDDVIEVPVGEPKKHRRRNDKYRKNIRQSLSFNEDDQNQYHLE